MVAFFPWFAMLVWWVPTVAVVAMALLAVLFASRRWLAPVVLIGAVAIAGTVWQQLVSRAELAGEAERLQGVSAQLDEIARALPGGGSSSPAGDPRSVTAAIGSLTGKLHDLEGQMAALRERYTARRLDGASAAKLADLLRPSGAGSRVVVSCLPEDLEAFGYATQLANAIRAAGWDALGPETTTIFGDAPAVGVTLYIRPGAGPETAKTLIDAFARLNIPYRAGIAPNEGIPDTATVELFVPPKP